MGTQPTQPDNSGMLETMLTQGELEVGLKPAVAFPCEGNLAKEGVQCRCPWGRRWPEEQPQMAGCVALVALLPSDHAVLTLTNDCKVCQGPGALHLAPGCPAVRGWHSPQVCGAC